MPDANVLMNQLPVISHETAQAYESKILAMTHIVDSVLTGLPDILHLIGGNPLEVMYQNHHNHARFMTNIFKFNQWELLVMTIPWVYHAYHSHGFEYNYFLSELNAWIAAIEAELPWEHARPVTTVYRFMINCHDKMIARAKSKTAANTFAPESIDLAAKEMLPYLLKCNTHSVLEKAEQMAASSDELMHFYVNVLQPCMYEVGVLWEKNEILVSHEHMVTGLVNRVMSILYSQHLKTHPDCGNAVVACVPGEKHEVGCRMVADLLEMDGWNIDYLGADTPADDLMALLMEKKPAFVALSVGMSFNLANAHEIVSTIRQESRLDDMRILIGGLICNKIPELWQVIGADGHAVNAQEAVMVARQWKN